MPMVKRTVAVTRADVYDPEGHKIAEVEQSGRLGAARMANVARRELKDPLATVRNIRYDDKTYSMSLARFIELADVTDNN